MRTSVSELAATKSGLRVLRALTKYRGKVFTIRELARTSGVSHPEVSRVVKEFERRGILRIQPVGRSKQVILNEESYFVKAVAEPLLKAEDGFLDALVSTIRDVFAPSPGTSVAIFGSFARGESGPSSDMDLAVVTKDRAAAIGRFAEASALVVSRFGVGLSPLFIDVENFRRKRGIAPTILESYIQVSGTDLRELAGR